MNWRIPCVGSLIFVGLGVVHAQPAGEPRPPTEVASERDPEQPLTYRLLADRDYAKAIEALTAELKAKPEDDRVRLLLGMAQLRSRQSDAAIATLEPLSKKAGSAWQMRALYWMAEALVQKNDYGRAAELYDGSTERLLSVERKAELAQIYVNLGKKALEPTTTGAEPDPAKAASLFALALDFPLKPEAREQLLRARAEALGKASVQATVPIALQTNEVYQNNIGIQPNAIQSNSMPRRALGVQATVEAAEVWGQLLKEFPESAGAPDAALQQALATLQIGNLDEARRLLTAMLARYGSSPLAAKAQLNLGRTFGMPQPPSERDLERGVSALRKFVEAYPNDPEVPQALLQIAQAYATHSRTDDAVAAFTDLIARTVKRPELEELAQARVQLGILLSSQERHDEAIEVFQVYLREHPSHRDWASVQGWMVDAEHAKAMKLYEVARRRHEAAETAVAVAMPNQPPVAAVATGLPEARAALDRFLQAHPVDGRNPTVLYTIGESFALEKADDKALDAWRRLASKYPDTEPASHGMFRTAERIEASGRLAEALEAFKKVTGEWSGAAQARVGELQAPALEVYTERSFRSAEKAKVHLNVRNVPRLTLKAYQLDLQTYFRKTHGTSGIESLDIALIAPDHTWTSEIPEYRAFERKELDLEMPFSTPGVWLVHLGSETLEATTMVLVTDLEILVRTVGGDALVYARDAATGAALPDVNVLLSSTDKIVAEGKTGADGVWLHHSAEDETLSDALRVFGWKAANVAATDLTASETSYGSEIESRAILFTDRPLYQPGDRVGLKGFVRLEDNGVLKTAAGREMQLEVTAPTGQILLARTLKLNEFGSVAAELQLPRQAALGNYRIRLSDDEEAFEDTFQVKQYALPKVLLTVVPETTTVVRGTPVKGRIRAVHAYGEPVANARLRYGLRQDPLLEGKTDAQGELQFEFPTTEMGEEATLDLFAELPEEAQAVTASATVHVAPTQFSLSVSTSSELYLAGERFEATVRSEDWSGKPAAAQTKVELVHTRVTDEGETIEQVVQTETVALDASGLGRAALSAKDGGDYRIRVRAQDSLGNTVLAEREIRISGQEDEQKLHLLTDLSTLMVGQKAELRLHSRLKTPAKALVTFEGSGILAYRLQDIAVGEGRLGVEAQGEYAPNFAVQVSALGDGRLHEARAEFSVRQGLSIEIRPKTETAQPGTEVEVEIRTLDHLGQPVSAEVALAVVDEALLALQADHHDSMASIFYGGSRSLSGTGACSCSFEYRATTETVSQEVLAELQKVQASEKRMARLEADESESMYLADSAEAVANMPAAPMMQSAISGGVMGGIAGGSVGGEMAPPPPPPPPPLVRKRFAETAYWGPTIVTDAAGKATVRFKMPDSTTTWRWLARGADRALLVGDAEARTVTKLDLVAEVLLPPAFVEGDKTAIRATAHNLSGSVQNVETRFAWRLGEDTSQDAGRMELASGQQKAVEMALPPLKPGDLTVTWNAGTDVLERTVPVLPWGAEESVQRVGVVTGETAFSLQLPAGAGQRQALELRFGLRWDRLLEELNRGSDAGMPLIAVHSDQAYQVLTAALLVQDLERNKRGQEAGPVRSTLSLALGDLISGQNADGGWAYAGRSGSDPLVSAESLVALTRAAGAGFETIVRTPRNAAEGRLWQWFREAQEDQLELKATLLWALSESGPVDFAYLNRLYRSRNSLSALSLARLTIAMVRAERAEIAAELADLLAKKRAAGAGAPFAADQAGLSDSTDPVVVAAFALRALGLAKPGAAEIAGIRDWVLEQRWGDGYGLRRRDAWVAAALFDAGTGQPAASTGAVRVGVRVNGKEAGVAEADPKAWGTVTLLVAGNLLKPGKNELVLTQQGTGRFTYAARLTGWNPSPKPRTENWKITREYGPDLLVRGGKRIPRGFSVVSDAGTPPQNKVENLEFGASLLARLSISRVGNSPAALRSSHVIVEEPLPAGCTLDRDSVTGDFLDFQERAGRIVFLLPRDRAYYQVDYRLLGRFSGTFGVLPTRLSLPDESGRTELGASRQLTVLAPNAKTTDQVRLSADELYHLGLWYFEQGDLAQARTYLDQLLAGGKLYDEPGHKVTRTLFEIASRLKESREMIRHFENLKERWPASILTYGEVLQVGQAYRQAGEHERAYSVFRAAAEASFLRDSQVSGALEKEGELDASIEVLESLLRDYPPHPTMDAAAYGLGQLLVSVAEGKGVKPQGELAVPGAAYAKAASLFQTYIVEHSDGAILDEVSFAWLSALLAIEDYPAAVTLARRSQVRYPKSVFLPSFEYVEGYGLFELRRYEPALAVLSKVAGGTYTRRDGTQGPSANRALSLLLAGQIHQAKRDLKAALGLYEQVQNDFPEARELRDYYLRHTLSIPEVTTVAPGTAAAVELTQTNLKEVQILVYKVDLMMLYLREKNLDALTGIELSGIAPDHEATIPIAEDPEFRQRKIPVQLPLTEPGAYLVVARAGEVDASGMVLVSDLVLTADEQPQSGRVRLFAEHQQSKEPAGRAHVKVVGSRDGLFQSGDTDLRGIFTVDNVQGAVTAIARSGEHYAFYRGEAELQPVYNKQSPSFDRKRKAMENLRKDFEEIQEQRMMDLRGIQYNANEGVEIKNTYR